MEEGGEGKEVIFCKTFFFLLFHSSSFPFFGQVLRIYTSQEKKKRKEKKERKKEKEGGEGGRLIAQGMHFQDMHADTLYSLRGDELAEEAVHYDCCLASVTSRPYACRIPFPTSYFHFHYQNAVAR